MFYMSFFSECGQSPASGVVFLSKQLMSSVRGFMETQLSDYVQAVVCWFKWDVLYIQAFEYSIPADQVLLVRFRRCGLVRSTSLEAGFATLKTCASQCQLSVPCVHSSKCEPHRLFQPPHLNAVGHHCDLPVFWKHRPNRLLLLEAALAVLLYHNYRTI